MRAGKNSLIIRRATWATYPPARTFHAGFTAAQEILHLRQRLVLSRPGIILQLVDLFTKLGRDCRYLVGQNRAGRRLGHGTVHTDKMPDNVAQAEERHRTPTYSSPGSPSSQAIAPDIGHEHPPSGHHAASQALYWSWTTYS